MSRARDLANFASDSQINAGEIEDSAVTTAKIADSNVTTAKIADSNVTNAKLANSTITLAGDSGSDSVALGETMTVAGGTGLTSTGSSNTITIAIDSTVATLTGTQTLTNKTINTASNTITVVEADISDLQSYILADSTDTLTNKTISGSSNTLSNIGNASLTNSSITVTDGSTSTAISLGGTITIQGTTNEIEVSESSGTVTIGLPSDTTIGNNLTIAGNLTVNGTTTTLNTTNTTVTGNLLELNSGATSNANDSGIIIERGSTGDNAIMAWDESADSFRFGTTTATASDTGNLTITESPVITGKLTVHTSDDTIFYSIPGSDYTNDQANAYFGFTSDGTSPGTTNYGYWSQFKITAGGGAGRTNLQIGMRRSDGNADHPDLVVTHEGRVGIGTSSPGTPLDVYSTNSSGRGLQVRAGDTAANTDSAQIILSYNGSSYDSNGYAHSIRTRHNSIDANTNAIDFWTWKYGTDTASTLGSLRVMSITGAGRVGIGTASPSYNLEVTGDAYVSTNLTIGGNLTVSGTTTTINTTNTTVTDNLLELNSGATSNANDSGILIERGTTGDNAIMAWDESADEFIFGTTTATASDTGNLTITASPISVGGITSSGNINLGNNTLNVGTTLDIFSTGTSSYIHEVGGGDLYIKGSNIYFTDADNNQYAVMADLGTGGVVSLKYTGSTKLATSNTGVTVTGTVVSDGLTVDTSTLYVDSSNNRVGIGTTSPASKFEVEDSVNGDMHLRINNTNTGASARTFLLLQSDGATGGLYLNGANSVNSGTNQADSITLTSDASASNGLNINATSGAIKFYYNNSETMRITSSGNVGIGTTSPARIIHVNTSSGDVARFQGSSGYIDVDGGGTQLSGSNGLQFRGTGSGSAPMVLSSGGNLGIGTTSPGAKLDVRYDHQQTDVTTANSYRVLNLHNAGTGDGVYNAIKFSANQQDMYIMSINHSSQSSRRLGFFVGSVAGDATTDERLTITGSGNVGIGTSSPESTLHVQGSEIKVKNSTNAFMTIEAGSASYQSIVQFSDGGASGAFTYNHPSNYLATKVNGSEAMRIDSSGNVLVGKTSATDAVGVEVRPIGYISIKRASTNLNLNRATTDGNIINFQKDSVDKGSVSVSSSGTTYNTTSDYRLKDNIEIITDGTERLMKLKPVRHSWKESSVTVDGFLAHEVQESGLEYAVTGKKDGKEMQSMDYGRITPVIVSALQDAIKEINSLKKRIEELESK